MSPPTAASWLFKMHSGFGLWISSLPSRCQTFAGPLSSCLLAPLLCYVFSKDRAQSQSEFWINRKPDAKQTFAWGKHFLQMRKKEEFRLVAFWYLSLILYNAAVSFHALNKSNLLDISIKIDALFVIFQCFITLLEELIFWNRSRTENGLLVNINDKC